MVSMQVRECGELGAMDGSSWEECPSLYTADRKHHPHGP